jgi:dTDP-4-dehydrorhamnose 3,5-epimerase
LKFHATDIEGAWWLELEAIEDERGFFARCYCREEFEEHGMNPTIAQCNLSGNLQRHTLRGMHAQTPPYEEAKTVRCIRGSVWDVVLDLRVGSPSYLQHFGIELSADNRRALYLPEGTYHGFITLEDDSELYYQISHVYVPGAAVGVRWNDPAFDIRWPAQPRVINPRDRDYPDHEPPEGGAA